MRYEKAAVVVPRIGGKWEVREVPTHEPPPCRLLGFERVIYRCHCICVATCSYRVAA